MEIYIDIETLPGAERPKPEDIEAPKNYKDPAKIRAYQQERVEEIYRSQALDSMRGRIVCIGWATRSDPAKALIVGQDGIETESELLASFQDNLLRLELDRIGKFDWIGHNLRSFDLPWLWRKALKHRLFPLAKMIPRRRYDSGIQDTMEMWAADFKDYVSLENIALFLGLTGKTSGMDGSKIYDFWLENRLDEIKEYCRQDVDTVRRVYRIISLEDIGLEKLFYGINDTALQTE